MRQLPALRIAIALVSACTLSAAHASTNLVSNGSFESVATSTTTYFISAGVSNWSNGWDGETLAMPSWYTNGYLFPGVGLAGNFPQTGPDGGNFVLSDADYHHTPITHTISGLSPGTKYTLTFYQALDQDTEPYVTTPGPVQGHWDVTFGGDTQSTPEMYANGATPSYSPWKQQAMTFTAHTATQVLSFFSVGAGDPPMAALDGVVLTAVPEPDSVWLLSAGVLVLGSAVLARRRKAAPRVRG